MIQSINNTYSDNEWEKFIQACQCCTACALARTRTHVVIGRGENLNAPVMLVGEGPGQQEDMTGQAFVGRAGKLLDLLMDALMFEPEDFYIANVVKCRPPNNREPLLEEAQACLPWLRFQVKYIRPAVIVCMGRIALKYIVNEDLRITRVRGGWIERPGYFRIMPTYHPSAALRDPGKKEVMYQDMKKVREYLEILKEKDSI